MRCAECGTENRDNSRFCGSCGNALIGTCPHCDAPLGPGNRFCTACGEGVPPGGIPQDPNDADPAAERRRVSVLFVDIEDFTRLAETLDPEEVRTVQSRYFETARSVIAKYGGTIEKFIGDAVMAVWGAPVTTRTTQTGRCGPLSTWSMRCPGWAAWRPTDPSPPEPP